MEPIVKYSAEAKFSALDAYMFQCGPAQADAYRHDLQYALAYVRSVAESGQRGRFILELKSCPCTIRYHVNDQQLVIWDVASPLLSEATSAALPDDGKQRQFSMAMLFGLVFAMALLFALLKWANASPSVVLGLAGYLGTVGVGQAVLFKGRHPRGASMLAGGFFAALWWVAANWRDTYGLPDVQSAALAGVIAGYLVGDVSVRILAHQAAKQARLNFQAAHTDKRMKAS